MTKKKNYKQISVTLRYDNPIESRLIELYEDNNPVQVGPYDYVSGHDLIRRLITMGVAAVEKEYPGQISKERAGAYAQTSQKKESATPEDKKSGLIEPKFLDELGAPVI